MTDLLFRLTRDGIVPEVSRPAPDRLVAGDPVQTTWNAEDRDGLCCGLWQSTPGAWRVAYDEWEYVRILSGHSVLTADSGEALVLKAGDSAVIRPGFRGIWKVVEATLKEYVIRQ